MAFPANIDGQFVFGYAVKIEESSHPNIQQMVEFFGINGVFTLFGGTRGRTFAISGILFGADIATLNAFEGILRSFADGLAHTLVDTRGRSWSNVIFRGDFRPDPAGPRPGIVPDGFGGTLGGWCLPYKAVMIGLT